MDAECILLGASPSPSEWARNFAKEFGKGNISDNCQFALKPRLAWPWHPVDNNHWLHPNIEKGQEQRGAHEGQSKSIFIIWVYFDFLKLSYELKNWIKWKLFLAKSKEVLGSSWTRRYSCRSTESNLYCADFCIKSLNPVVSYQIMLNIKFCIKFFSGKSKVVLESRTRGPFCRIGDQAIVCFFLNIKSIHPCFACNDYMFSYHLVLCHTMLLPNSND